MQRLDCVVQEYAWGDLESIPALLRREPNGRPAAELWMGAHPKAPSRALADDAPLNELIAADPDSYLGTAVAQRFGQLPFLFKILAAGEPLSIQSHPSLEQAQVGFAREEAAGIAIGAFERTYRDANHKPELICALTPFVAKVGFKPLALSQALFAALATVRPGLVPVSDQLAKPGEEAAVLRNTLAWLLGLPAGDSAVLVADLLAAAADCDEPRFGAELGWVPGIHQAFPGDIGGVVALLLNHVELEPGEAVYLGAGNLHAYVRGTGVELMANSDNVVRGGLTPKNIDVAELMNVVDATPLHPEVQRATGAVHTYASPVGEFSLTRVTEPTRHDRPGPHIVIVTDGAWELEVPDSELLLEQGDVGFVAASDGPLDLRGTGTVFIASPGDLDAA